MHARKGARVGASRCTETVLGVLAVLAAVLGEQFAPVPPGGITFHVSVVTSEIEWLRSVDRRHILPFRQCFTELVVVLDLPHGGKTYHRRYLPLVRSPPLPLLRARVKAAIAPAQRLLRSHCVKAARLRIILLNHTTLVPWMHRAFATTDNITTVTPDSEYSDDRPDLPLPQRFFMNSVMYVWSMLHSRTRFLLHVDSDTLGYYPTHVRGGPMIPSFVATSVAELVSTPLLLATEPTNCGQTESFNHPLFSCRFFLVDKLKTEMMVPMQRWADHVEDMIKFNMRRTNLFVRKIAGRPCAGGTWLTRKVLHNTNWQ